MTIGDYFVARDFVWSESSGLNVSTSPFVEESNSNSQANEDGETRFVRHGRILEADLENIDMQCNFWSHCAIGFLLDYRKFSILYLQ